MRTIPGILGDDDCERPSNDPVDNVCNVGGGVDSLPELPLPLGIGYNDDDDCCTEMEGNNIFVVLLEYTGIRGEECVDPEPDDNDNVVVDGGGNKVVAGPATVEDDGKRCDCEV